MKQPCLICLLSILAVFLKSVYSASDLQKACEQHASSGSQAVYKWSSCITYPDGKYNWTTSNTKCDEFDNGHLLALPVVEMLDIIASFTSLEDSWLGAAQIPGSAEPYGGWEWHLAGGRVVPLLMPNQQGMGIWQGGAEPNQFAGRPEDCLRYRKPSGNLQDTDCQSTQKRFCQYGMGDTVDIFMTDMSSDDTGHVSRKYTMMFPKSKGNDAGKLAEYTNMMAIGCANRCSADPICHSISFKQDDGHCILNLDDGTYPGFEAESDQDYDVFVWKLG